jgi:hypothetical protein
MKFVLPWLLISYIPHDASIVFGDPAQTAAWDLTPNIIICDGAPISVDRVHRGVEYWRRLGHKIGTVTAADRGHLGCLTGSPRIGEIHIDLASQSFKMEQHIGFTRTWSIKDTKEIFKSRIEIMSGWGNTERVIEHELGHALGFRDYNQTGHIMHSNWSRGGHKFKGLERKQENNYSKENILNGI